VIKLRIKVGTGRPSGRWWRQREIFWTPLSLFPNSISSPYLSTFPIQICLFFTLHRGVKLIYEFLEKSFVPVVIKLRWMNSNPPFPNSTQHKMTTPLLNEGYRHFRSLHIPQTFLEWRFPRKIDHSQRGPSPLLEGPRVMYRYSCWP
jgi:hypothetical protein